MSKKPYLFLDVDGVLNALDGLNQGDWDDIKKVKVLAPLGGVQGSVYGKFTLHISKKMCAALAALPVEIHWATTWEHLANELLWEYTNLNDYPVACRMADGIVHLTADPWWKFEGIKRLVTDDPRPVIWLDDEAIPPHAADWFDEHGIPHLLIAPDEAVGVTREHIRRIKNFLKTRAVAQLGQRT